jgi:isopenicillin N synthase-like dioxygenase
VEPQWEIWSNGLYKSTLHRVIHRSSTYRVSLPFFYEPAFDALVKPLEAAKRKQEEEGWVVSKVYNEVTYGEFLLAKVGGNFVKGVAS